MTYITKKEFDEFQKKINSNVNDLRIILEIICSANDEKIEDLKNNLDELRCKLPEIKEILERNINTISNIQESREKVHEKFLCFK